MEKNQYENLIAVAITGGLIGILVGIASGIIQQKYGTWGRFLRGMLAATVVAILIALALDHTHLATTTKASIVAAVCYVADDVLMGMATLGKLFAGDPVAFIKRFANIPGAKTGSSDNEGNR